MSTKLKLVSPELEPSLVGRLLDTAEEMLKSPFSFGVEIAVYGAAVLTTNQAIYGGRNRFSPSHSLTMHAEQVALAHCFAHGDPFITAIAVASSDRSAEPLPCGMCRQLLFENARHSGCDILVVTRAGSHSLSELYPLPWPDRAPLKS